jgi:hypothetical protein
VSPSGQRTINVYQLELPKNDFDNTQDPSFLHEYLSRTKPRLGAAIKRGGSPLSKAMAVILVEGFIFIK